MNQSLLVHLRPSLTLTWLLVIAHGVIAILLSLLTLTLVIKSSVAVFLLCSFIFYVRKDALLLSRNAVVKIELFGKSECHLTTRSGSRNVCQILEETFVSSFLTVMILRPRTKFLPITVVILPDNVNSEEFRQLRIWLRWRYTFDKKVLNREGHE